MSTPSHGLSSSSEGGGGDCVADPDMVGSGISVDKTGTGIFISHRNFYKLINYAKDCDSGLHLNDLDPNLKDPGLIKMFRIHIKMTWIQVIMIWIHGSK